ncbi:hypothetical protein CRENBAI_004040 [Crenichthys baileyi]|uniref:Uncharacterized protein n=1 Tax=Crenichthys baileyi TaxID=28760 RepID=A0AAV9QPS8_9TELE
MCHCFGWDEVNAQATGGIFHCFALMNFPVALVGDFRSFFISVMKGCANGLAGYEQTVGFWLLLSSLTSSLKTNAPDSHACLSHDTASAMYDLLVIWALSRYMICVIY